MLLDHDYLNTQETVNEGFTADYAADFAPLDRSTVLMLSMLELLYAEHAQGRAQVSLAVICKRLDVRMSTVQRLMTALEEQQLVQVCMQKDRLVAALTANGEEISQVLKAA